MKTFALLLLALSACAPLEAPTSEIVIVPWGEASQPAATSRRAFSFAESPCRPEIEEAFANLEKAYGVTFYEDPAGVPFIVESMDGEGGTTAVFHAREDIDAGRLYSTTLRARDVTLWTCNPIVIAHEALHAVGLLHTTFGLMDGDGVGSWDLNEEQVEYLLSLP